MNLTLSFMETMSKAMSSQWLSTPITLWEVVGIPAAVKSLSILEEYMKTSPPSRDYYGIPPDI